MSFALASAFQRTARDSESGPIARTHQCSSKAREAWPDCLGVSGLHAFPRGYPRHPRGTLSETRKLQPSECIFKRWFTQAWFGRLRGEVDSCS